MAERGNPTGTPYSGAQENHPNKNTNQSQGQQSKGDKQYKNIETKVDNRDYFGDDYEVQQEGQISREEAKTEKENRPDKRERK
jgi:hypothetical protein